MKRYSFDVQIDAPETVPQETVESILAEAVKQAIAAFSPERTDTRSTFGYL